MINATSKRFSISKAASPDSAVIGSYSCRKSLSNIRKFAVSSSTISILYFIYLMSPCLYFGIAHDGFIIQRKCRFKMSRKPNAERCSFIQSCIYGYFSAVTLDYTEGDRQAEASTFAYRFSRIKWVENALQVLNGDPAAGVRNLDKYIFVVAACDNSHFAPVRTNCLGRIYK